MNLKNYFLYANNFSKSPSPFKNYLTKFRKTIMFSESKMQFIRLKLFLSSTNVKQLLLIWIIYRFKNYLC
jgi:hypothetical protein